MTNPPYILDYLADIAEILNHPRVYAFLHVPVQAGSNSVLEDMQREYTNQDFCKVVDYLRQHVPDVTIATDIICGYPTETESDFEETLDLVRQYQFPSLFINQFFPRPGTPAAKLKKIPAQIVKQRTKQASDIFQSQFPYSHKLGRLERVLITEMATDEKHLVGHNKSYDQVILPFVKEHMGQTVTVQITETGKHFMRGKIMSHDVGLAEIPSVYSNPNNLSYKSRSVWSPWTFLIFLVLGFLCHIAFILYRQYG